MKRNKLFAVGLALLTAISVSACSVTPEELADAAELLKTLETASPEASGEVGLPAEEAEEETAEELPEEACPIELTEAEFPLYFRSPKDESTIRLFFADENREIPYLDMETAKDLMERVFHEINRDEEISFSYSVDGEVVTFTRENGATMDIDCDRDRISFDDLDAFFVPSWSNTVIDVLEHYGGIDCLEPVRESSYSRHGAAVDFDLGAYGIDLIGQGGACYIPMQVLSDIVLSLPCYVNLLYNREAVFVHELTDVPTDLFVRYYAAKPVERSEALADFTYRELCMVMDYCYGLKEQHGIESFDDFFRETGLESRLKSTDALEATQAMVDLAYVYIADLHTYYYKHSWLFDNVSELSYVYGSSVADDRLCHDEYQQARKKYYPDGVPGYEEIGNTAYITLDSFKTMDEGADYYETAPAADTADTVGLILYAFSQINREDSPVENVVLDLSLNSGGDTTTTSFVLSALLGETGICVENTLTGAYVSESFRADVNLDHVFDEQDSLRDRKLYCLTSRTSFSCANLVASVLRNSGGATILGQASGGGACIVMPISVADGTLLWISGYRRLSCMKNGAVYDIDRGVEPHFIISEPEHFYDREALTNYINGLY